LSSLTPDFGRALPNSVYHGEFGSLFGSPVFGPGLIGPFNDPILRQARIEELYNINRQIHGRPPMSGANGQFRLSNTNLRSLPLEDFLGGMTGVQSLLGGFGGR
jgi:hypothetical protein